MYDAIKKAKADGKDVVYYAEGNGVTKTAVDNMIKDLRRYGNVNITGDISVLGQLNGLEGYMTVGGATIPAGADVLAEEIRKTGLVSFYNTAKVVEIPNQYNFSKVVTNKTGEKRYALYLPEGLMFFLPKGAVSPLQVVTRGNLTSMTGDDIITGQRMTRFDMEFGAGVPSSMTDQIGIFSDVNFEAPKRPF